jgi:hypothetical protein
MVVRNLYVCRSQNVRGGGFFHVSYSLRLGGIIPLLVAIISLQIFLLRNIHEYEVPSKHKITNVSKIGGYADLMFPQNTWGIPFNHMR